MAADAPAQQQWLPLEANPDVMNKFVRGMGVKSTEYAYTDVFGLDPELLAMVPQPVLSVLLLYPITEAEEKHKDEQNAKLKDGSLPAAPVGTFSMRQTISNACGTIGLVHSIANNRELLDIEEGSYLDKFFKASEGKSRDEIGAVMEQANDISVAHEAAASEGQTAPPAPDEVVLLHFVCFVERDGKLVELDGRKDGDIVHGDTTKETLLQDSAVVVKKFMERNPTEHNFAVVALAKA